MRNVEFIIAPPEPHFVGDGFRVHNFIPSVRGLDMYHMDPFIMLDYNSKYEFPATDRPRGVGVHPHRGFETVTIAYKGKVAHHDSNGGSGVIEEGDVQWMTAASGVLHKEYHEKEWSKKGGVFQMVQLWVNLPAKYKMTEPKYQSIANNSIQRYQLDNDMGEIEIIAGEYKDVKGPAETFTPIHLYNLKVKKGAELEFSFPSHYNTALLAIEGSGRINHNDVLSTNHFAKMSNNAESFVIKAEEDSIFLLMSGEPIKEPIAAHGPFVMNSREELIQAFNDFNLGKFGYLEDDM